MILDRDGLPQPPSGVVDSLKRIDGTLGLAWIGDYTTGWWAVTKDWLPTDRRWAMVQKGEMKQDDAFDVVVYLPADCSAEQAHGYFMNAVRAATNKNIADMLDRLDNWNKQQVEKNWLAAAEPALEQASTAKSAGIPFSAGGMESPFKKKRKAKAEG